MQGLQDKQTPTQHQLSHDSRLLMLLQLQYQCTVLALFDVLAAVSRPQQLPCGCFGAAGQQTLASSHLPVFGRTRHGGGVNHVRTVSRSPSCNTAGSAADTAFTRVLTVTCQACWINKSSQDAHVRAQSCKRLRLCADPQALNNIYRSYMSSMGCMCVLLAQCVARQSTPGRSVVEARKMPLTTRPAASMAMPAAERMLAGGGVSLPASTTTTTVCSSRITHPVQGCGVGVAAMMPGSHLQDTVLHGMQALAGRPCQILCRLATVQT